MLMADATTQFFFAFLYLFQAIFIDNKEFDEFPMFPNMRSLLLGACFLDECKLTDKMEALGTFLQNAPRLETLCGFAWYIFLCYPSYHYTCLAILHGCYFQKFYEDSDKEWDIERKNIDLKRHDQNIFHWDKLKAVKVIYKFDHDHRLVELLWRISSSLPDAIITLSKI